MSERIEMAGQCGDNCIDVVWCTVIGRCKRLGGYILEETRILPEITTYPEEQQHQEVFAQPLGQG